jgi:hypothetical protein
VRIKLMLVMLLMATVVAACGAPSAPPTFPTASSKLTPTMPPSVLPTMPPSVLPTMPPSVLPTEVVPGKLVTRPTAEEWKNAPAAALSAAADLAQRLKIDIDTIKLVSVEQIDWPDACMGIQQPGVMCAQVITSGYKVVLEANGQQYEYHTNETGSVVRLVGS